jgi:hypothetical protein
MHKKLSYFILSVFMVAAFAIMSAPAMAQGFYEENTGGTSITILYSMLNEGLYDNGFGGCLGYEMPMDETTSIDFLLGYRTYSGSDTIGGFAVSADGSIMNLSIDYKTWFGGEELATAGTGFYFRGGIGYYSGDDSGSVEEGGEAYFPLFDDTDFGYNLGAGYVFGDGGFGISADWHKAFDVDWIDIGLVYTFN